MMDIRQIMECLPHRYPLLLVDRVISTEPFKRIEAIKNVSFNEPFFLGHFPDYPIMPGVLQVEAMAQTAGILAIVSTNMKDQNCYFLSIEKAKFRKPVVPGDQLRITVDVTQNRNTIWKFSAQAHVGDTLCSEAEFTAMMTAKEI